jgi:hypothetical protein
VGIIVLAPLFMMGSYRGFGGMDGMMGQWYEPRYSQEPLGTIDQAEVLAKQYLSSLNKPDLAVKEIMEFEYNFYIIFYEESTGLGAFEMLIWKKAPRGMMDGFGGHGGMMGGGMMGSEMMVGQIMPEPGPNMMWNTKYGGMMGHMSGGMMGGGMMDGGMDVQGQPTGEMPIGVEEAKRIGQQYLDEYFSGKTIEESTQFYGYYTFDFGEEGKIYGMFSINGYTGQAWYHGWHGEFIHMEEYGEEHGD